MRPLNINAKSIPMMKLKPFAAMKARSICVVRKTNMLQSKETAITPPEINDRYFASIFIRF